MQIRKGTEADIEALAALYDGLNDYLSCHVNYPGWIKGIYPTREDAARGVEEGCLFVAVADGSIAGTVILRHRPEEGYRKVDWKILLDDQEIFVVYTLAVHPRYLHMGVGKALMEFVLTYASRMHMKAVRLDVYEKNLPAICLYEEFGFQYMATVDLGYGMYGLDRFRLYQRLIPSQPEDA